MAPNAAFSPLSLQQFKVSDFQTEEGVTNLNQVLSLMTQRINAVQGNVGKVSLPAGVDMAGAPIENVNAVGPQHSAISHAQAEAKYSASAIGPQLEAGQPTALRSMRRLNDPTQTEFHSNFLEGILSTSPTTNNSTITGSGTSVTVSAGYHLFPSGNIVPYASRTDTVSLPSGVTILTLTLVSGVVTVVTSTPHGLSPGGVVDISGASDVLFDGEWAVTSTPTTTSFTFSLIAPNVSATGGTVTEGVIYYFFLQGGQKTLSFAGPFGADSQSNRLGINKDGNVLIAVASFAGGSFNSQASAAGTTPPQTTNGNHILTRL